MLSLDYSTTLGPPSGGPLMTSAISAASTLVIAFEERRAVQWLQELEDAGVSLPVWIDQLIKQVHRVNRAAQRAAEEENFSLSLYDRTTLTDVQTLGWIGVNERIRNDNSSN